MQVRHDQSYLLIFNKKGQTCSLDEEMIISVCGDILPDPFSNIARDNEMDFHDYCVRSKP